MVQTTSETKEPMVPKPDEPILPPERLVFWVLKIPCGPMDILVGRISDSGRVRSHSAGNRAFAIQEVPTKGVGGVQDGPHFLGDFCEVKQNQSALVL